MPPLDVESSEGDIRFYLPNHEVTAFTDKDKAALPL